jgi:hypothetical protein
VLPIEFPSPFCGSEKMLLGLLLFLIEVLMCIVLPLFFTLRTILQDSPKYQIEYKRWITYWVLFILINGFFFWIDIDAAKSLKVLMLVALAIPRLGFSTMIYDQVNDMVISKAGEHSKALLTKMKEVLNVNN